MKSLTDEYAEFWAETLSKKYQLEKVIEWANLLEKELEMRDPMYKFNFGKNKKEN